MNIVLKVVVVCDPCIIIFIQVIQIFIFVRLESLHSYLCVIGNRQQFLVLNTCLRICVCIVCVSACVRVRAYLYHSVRACVCVFMCVCACVCVCPCCILHSKYTHMRINLKATDVD